MATRLGRALVALGVSLMGAACDDNPPADIVVPGRDAGASQVMDAGPNVGRDASVLRDAGGSFRDGSVTPQDDCDPVTQSDCVPPATKCVVEGTTPGTKCVSPGFDEFGLGEPCTGRDCAPGLACVRAASTSTASRCVQVCDIATAVGCEALGPDYDCNIRISGSNWGACSELPELCDPYTQDPCDAALACQPWRRRDGTWEFRCRSGGAGQSGDLCTAGNPECARGLACVATSDGNAFCRQYCELNTDCTAPKQCVGTVRDPPFMYCAE